MLRKILCVGPRLSAGVIRLVASAAILLYVLMYWKASTFLPEFVFRDSDKIQSQVSGSSTYQDTSFDAVAKFYSSLGDTGTTLFVVSVGSLFIWLMVGCSKRLGSLFVNMVLIAPCVFFNLFVASKDTLVVLASIVLVLIGRKWHVGYVIAAAVVFYVGYAMTVRIYFVLILAVAVGVWVFRAGSPGIRTVLVLATLLGLLMLPDTAYFALMHPRDMAVDYLVAGSPYGARTGFYNFTEPVSFAAFIADYVFAILKLDVPVLFHPGPKEFVMLIFVWIAVGAVSGKRTEASANINARTLNVFACLVIGHMAVSMLFELDLGSYTRHLASVALFCAWQLRHVGARSDHSPAAVQMRYSSVEPEGRYL